MTLYDRLGITPHASENAIQQAFYRLAGKFDPNHAANRGSADAREQYRAVHDAYRTLSDPEARRIYDRSLKMPSLKQRVQSARTVARVQGN